MEVGFLNSRTSTPRLDPQSQAAMLDTVADASPPDGVLDACNVHMAAGASGYEGANACPQPPTAWPQAEALLAPGEGSDLSQNQLPFIPVHMNRLREWIAGRIALSRSEAHQLLESVVECGQITHYRAEFVAAVKALAAGPRSWRDMGYRLLPEE